MPPKPRAPWSGTLSCFGYGQAAPQVPVEPSNQYAKLLGFDLIPGFGGLGEDCLNLNIWSPGLDAGKRPVLISFHGGGFVIGSSSPSLYDGAQLSKLGDVVVVTVNHRLGLFGYLDLDGAGPPSRFAAAGSAGLLDLVAALEWVRDNIAAFGGDPGCVTIFGQSGGGWKVSALMAMPSANGLYHRAAVQSGSLLQLPTRPEAAHGVSSLLSALDIANSQLEKLQDLPWEALLAVQAQVGAYSFMPVCDGEMLPQQPQDGFLASSAVNVPLMISTTLDDAGLFSTDFDLDKEALEAMLDTRFGPESSIILAICREAQPQKSPYLLQAEILTDMGFRRFAYEQAERKAALGAAPVYLYQWDWVTPAYDGKFGAVHGADTAASFANAAEPVLGSGSPQGELVTRQLSSAWVAFARTGDPNTPELPTWAPYETGARSTMVFSHETQLVDDPRSAQRKFWASQPMPASILG